MTNQNLKPPYNKALESYTYSDIDGDNNKGTRLDPDKFAALIIQECIDCCYSVAGNADYNTGRIHCVNDIETHFEIQNNPTTV